MFLFFPNSPNIGQGAILRPGSQRKKEKKSDRALFPSVHPPGDCMNVLVRVRGRYWYYFGKWRWKERRVLTLNENLIVIRHEGNLEERFLLSGSSIVTQHFYAPLAHCVMIKCSNDKIERPIVGFYEEGDCNAFLIQCKNTIKGLAKSETLY